MDGFIAWFEWWIRLVSAHLKKMDDFLKGIDINVLWGRKVMRRLVNWRRQKNSPMLFSNKLKQVASGKKMWNCWTGCGEGGRENPESKTVRIFALGGNLTSWFNQHGWWNVVGACADCAGQRQPLFQDVRERKSFQSWIYIQPGDSTSLWLVRAHWSFK